MKYAVSLAVAMLVALAATGGALAADRTAVFVRTLEAPPHVLRLLHDFPRDPKRPHLRVRQSHVHRARGTTLSLYEQTATRWVLARQGCSAARRDESGVVVLDFGKPAYARGGYGTILFSGRFATNHKITRAMLGYAKGYTSCLPKGSSAFLVLARGTSNYHPAVPSAYTAGLRWGREMSGLARLLGRHWLASHVAAAAADDAEPAWDPRFRKTRDFVHGYRVAAHGHTLYDYGSLDGGIGAIWSARQALYVVGATRASKALPEIYYPAMAREWAEFARVARSRYHRQVRFAGVMTQGRRHCRRCGLGPDAAHHALARALASSGVQNVPLPHAGTDIIG